MCILTSKKEGEVMPQSSEFSNIGRGREAPKLEGSSLPVYGEKILSFSTFTSSKDSDPRARIESWDAFCQRFSKHPIRQSKDGPAWSPSSYKKGAKRGNEGVERLHFAVIDVDDGTPFESVAARLEGFAFLAHSSFSHTSEKPKYRLILPFAEPVDPTAWSSVWTRINELMGGCNDAATKDPARLYFMPAHPAGGVHFTSSKQVKRWRWKTYLISPPL